MPTSRADWIASSVDQFQAPLTRYATRMLGDVQRAQDVVQDTFLKLWQANRTEVDGHLAPWLYTVCRNRALDELRKDGRMSALREHAADPVVARADAETPAPEKGERVNAALELLQTLPARQQEVLRLKFQSGLSYREIGEVMDLTVSHVGVLIHNAIKSIRQQLDRAAPDDRSHGIDPRLAGGAR
ncbi:MAG: RNA polymerase sigma factor [Planctomycetota bacterium]|jgi:RNA polymerase sigma-70 factor (ECF subfamily)